MTATPCLPKAADPILFLLTCCLHVPGIVSSPALFQLQLQGTKEWWVCFGYSLIIHLPPHPTTWHFPLCWLHFSPAFFWVWQKANELWVCLGLPHVGESTFLDPMKSQANRWSYQYGTYKGHNQAVRRQQSLKQDRKGRNLMFDSSEMVIFQPFPVIFPPVINVCYLTLFTN